MSIKTKIKQLLVTSGIIKPYTLYKGQKVTPFKYDRVAFFNEYIRIVNKISQLSANKRRFVVNQVESWLNENDINVKEFQDELRS